MGIWEFGNLGIWEFGNLGIWEFGNLGIWEFGKKAKTKRALFASLENSFALMRILRALGEDRLEKIPGLFYK